MEKKFWMLLGGLFFHLVCLHAQREMMTVNDGWLFRKGEDVTLARLPADDAWERVHLPHTWNTDAYTVKEYYKGIGWYRKYIAVPSRWQDKRIFLRMDAASKAATVYLNGHRVGVHKGGYTGCCLELTPYLSGTGTDTLTIQVDNARQDIPPVSGDFTFFGGIYRDVWLMALPGQHFEVDAYGADELFISTPQVSAEQATVKVCGKVRNQDRERKQVEVVCSLYHPDGQLLSSMKQTLRVDGGESAEFCCSPVPVSCPLLWTPETPHLYRVETVLYDKKSRQQLDSYVRHTAFRWFAFDGNEGFKLNGKPYKLRGMCRHQDQKPIGVALTDEMHRRDFRLMKEMGANFLRISHYPQDEALLELCDKSGMLVWEEIPVIDIVPDNPDYADCCERNLREMIRQHYNHPSIVMWGYMNEILLVTQRTYKKPEELEPALERTLALAHRLEKVLKEEDPTRVSTMAFHGSDSYNEVGLGDITDVVGWNLYQGWYGGKLSGFDEFLARQHRNHPTHPLIVSEYGAGSDRRIHSLAPRAFDFSMEYQQLFLEHYLPVLEHTPYVCGSSHWNFIDFSSALRDESMPRINNKGLVYADRSPKDVYYYYQAMWRQDVPVLHIATRDWNRRSGMKMGDDPVVQPVKVYTNLPEVTLFVDGKEVRKVKVQNCTATFLAPFTKSDAYLHAEGVWNNQKVEDGCRIQFTFIPGDLKNWKAEQDVELAVNVGSRCFYTSEESGLTWMPDVPYFSGGWGHLGGEEAATKTEITGTADGPLLQTQCKGLEGYRFDVPKGVYELELFFTDIDREENTSAYLLADDGQKKEGQNRFDVYVNGRLIEENFAPCGMGGYFHQVRKRYLVTTDLDYLEVRFAPISGKTFLNAVKLRKNY